MMFTVNVLKRLVHSKSAIYSVSSNTSFRALPKRQKGQLDGSKRDPESPPNPPRPPAYFSPRVFFCRFVLSTNRSITISQDQETGPVFLPLPTSERARRFSSPIADTTTPEHWSSYCVSCTCLDEPVVLDTDTILLLKESSHLCGSHNRYHPIFNYDASHFPTRKNIVTRIRISILFPS